MPAFSQSVDIGRPNPGMGSVSQRGSCCIATKVRPTPSAESPTVGQCSVSKKNRLGGGNADGPLCGHASMNRFIQSAQAWIPWAYHGVIHHAGELSDETPSFHACISGVVPLVCHCGACGSPWAIPNPKQKMAPVPGANILRLDFMDIDAPEIIKKALGGQADAVLSDMAPKITGHANTDHIRIMALAETAYDFAKKVLAPGGCLISKVFQGGTEKVLLNDMKLSFSKVRHSKPPSSRAESAEMFVVAQDYRKDADK